LHGAASKHEKESFMKKSALVIGQFIKEEHVFKGKIKTLAIDATVTLQPNDDDSNDRNREYRP
jgi:uncharacterized protein (DUF736 family)